MNDKQQYDLGELILKSLNGTAGQSDSVQLRRLLAEEPEAMDYYMDYVSLYAYLKSPGNVSFPQSEDSFDLQTWQLLAEYEKTAPEIEIPEEKQPQELIQKVIYPPQKKRRVSKFNLVFLALNAAAVLFIVLFLKFAPSQPIEVATLSDTMNAKWADMDFSMYKGVRLVNNSEPLMLRRGMVELTFDNQTRAVIEAPAEFQILADDRIGLIYGKVYATVPSEGIGFSIYTPNAKIIDLGTEFGVHAEPDGDLQLHVLKGKTMLMVGEKDNKSSIEVNKGMAKEISAQKQSVKDIPCQETAFVRDFDSAKKIVWRCQPSTDSDATQEFADWLAYSYQIRQDPDLVLYYPFMKSDELKEHVSNYAAKTSGKFSATFGGDFGISNFTNPSWTSGRWPNKAGMKFERDKRTVMSIEESPELSLGSDITLAVWVCCPDSEKGGHLISNRSEDGINYHFGCFSDEDPYFANKLQFLRSDEALASSISSAYSDKPFYWTSDWTFLAVTYDGETAQFYVNGELFEAVPFVFNRKETPDRLYIGDVPGMGGKTFGYAAFNGIIDELAIFKRVLSSHEIQRMYEAGKP